MVLPQSKYTLIPHHAMLQILYAYKAVHNLAPVYLKGPTAFVLLHFHQLPDAFALLQSLISSFPRDPHHDTLWRSGLFIVIAPTLWNKLPTYIQAAPSLDTFKSQLKTHLFYQSGYSA